jgi:phosphatidate cytidylyltransferase
MKDLQKRTIWGALFVAILVGSILLGEFTFAPLFLIISAASLKEFFDITRKADFKPQYITGIISGIILFSISFLTAYGVVSAKILLIMIPLSSFILISELYRKKENPLQNIAITFLGIIYVSVPFSLMNFIVFQDVNVYNPDLFLSLFIFIWVNDSGAYMAGTAFGKHRLFERISPKKSWEGFIGGLLSTVLVAYILSVTFVSEYSFAFMTIIAVIIVVTGTLGDLVESLFKRNLGVKDSGKVIPGHGGLLDRFDSIILAAPIVFFVFYLLS